MNALSMVRMRDGGHYDDYSGKVGNFEHVWDRSTARPGLWTVWSDCPARIYHAVVDSFGSLVQVPR